MYMEKEQAGKAVLDQFCHTEPSLSCSQGTYYNELNVTVTWNAQAVITKGTFSTLAAPSNGDHDFLCVRYQVIGQQGMASFEAERAFVSVKGNVHS